MRDDLRWGRLALLAGLLIGNQYAAGALNDAVDAEADAAADRGKPIQRGVISRRAVATAAVVAGVASLGFGLALGPATFALAVVGLACAWSYDLWLKGTMFSALPFAVAVPIVPLFETIEDLQRAPAIMRELLTVGKLWELAQLDRRTPGAEPYDLVIVDAPATGHGVAVLSAPRAFAGAAHTGPVARQARSCSNTGTASSGRSTGVARLLSTGSP